MSQHEYGVPLGAKPDEMSRVALAFRAGEQKERDRIRNELIKMSTSGTSHTGIGALVWTRPLIETLGVDESHRTEPVGHRKSQSQS